MSKLTSGSTKLCKKCNLPKSLGAFGANRKHKDGLQYVCKECDSIYKKQYRIDNKEKIKKGMDKYRAENHEQLKESKARYEEENRDRVKQIKRASYLKKRPIHTAQHPLKFLISRAEVRARKMKYDFDLSYDYMLELWDKQEGKCYYTGLPMSYTYGKKNPYQVSIDKKDCAGGYTKENSVLCCLSINYAKSDFTEEQLKDFLLDLK